MMQKLNFDEAVAMVRANEGKIQSEEREELERKIGELSKELAQTSNKPEENASKKKKKGSRLRSELLLNLLSIYR
ncbi:hypothetical protein K469DRAFT_714592 [Zopfia rhizophila CBS 207.26]|uniref:Uncharacterized protein n=1 Tax=Zopfia rhizophila CBS 207.26 TaxID=1314779 RepID=A0A6A6DQD9_9PEZI|nr:hypothetical protein K469DRAFT_714592 [Zopfia rhizophila CBS 207.26]